MADMARQAPGLTRREGRKTADLAIRGIGTRVSGSLDPADHRGAPAGDPGGEAVDCICSIGDEPGLEDAERDEEHRQQHSSQTSKGGAERCGR